MVESVGAARSLSLAGRYMKVGVNVSTPPLGVISSLECWHKTTIETWMKNRSMTGNSPTEERTCCQEESRRVKKSQALVYMAGWSTLQYGRT